MMNKTKELDNIKTPSVSVIIPCYNSETLLDETMESLEKQSCKDFEVVCIDDGSTDGTLEVLHKWEKKNGFNIRIVRQKNNGVSAARNKGISEAKGEIILFLDSDDIYHSSFIEKILNGLKKADIAYCKLNRNLKIVYRCNSSKKEFKVQNIKEAMNKLLYEMGSYGFYCYAYKKELINKYNLRFDEDTAFGEDREFIWKYIAHCKKAAWLDLPLYGYRRNPNSATKRLASWRKTDSLKAVKRTESYLEDNNCVFAEEYKSYMFARVMWSTAKMFSVSKDRELFDRLQDEFDVRSCMKRTASDPNILVRIASRMFLMNPTIFYNLVGLKK